MLPLITITSESMALMPKNSPAIKINDAVVPDEKFIINQELFTENYLKLSIGKKRHIKIELS